MPRIKPGINDLQTLYPDIAKEWDYQKNRELSPSTIGSQSSKKVWWICPDNHGYDMRVDHRTRGCGCPYCSSQRPIVGVNDFGTVYPELAKEWDYEKNKGKRPEDYTSTSGQKVSWLCKLKHTYIASIAHRVNGTGCPYCAGKKVLKGFNDLETLYPEIAKEWDFEKNSLKPSGVSSGSNTKFSWVCPLGHGYDAVVYSRIGGTGCPYCAGRKVLVGFNDLDTTNPDLAKEWDYTKNIKTPTEVTAGSHSYTWWICKERHSWRAQIKSRTTGVGCPTCAQPHLEKYTEAWLISNKFDYKSQVRFPGLKGLGAGSLTYDFGIKKAGKYICLIECQGIQHYEPLEIFGGEEQFARQLEHDKLKREYAEKRNIKLIEIPYTCDTLKKVSVLLDEQTKHV